jgi:hypothetical protein
LFPCRFCKKQNAHLLTISSESELRFVEKNIVAVLNRAGQTRLDRELWWTSGRRKTYNKFVWKDGTS